MSEVVGMTSSRFAGPEVHRYRIIGTNPRVGVCVQGRDCFPGDEVDAPENVMAQIVAMGKAELVDPAEVRVVEPVVETRDPPTRARKRRRRQ